MYSVLTLILAFSWDTDQTGASCETQFSLGANRLDLQSDTPELIEYEYLPRTKLGNGES